MMTPQDIESMEFAKAVFGGYDMAAVDDFLEQVTADYSALYKDNMVLKGKLKVLVEKVEEYRSTEDAMRMALLSAQKMSDDMLAETKKKCDDMLAEANRASDASRAKVAENITQEDMKLEAAKIKTSSFVAASRQIIEQYQAFLNKLETVTAEYSEGAPEAKQVPAPAPAPAPTQDTVRYEPPVQPAPPAPVQPPVQERVKPLVAPEPVPAPAPEPVAAPTPAPAPEPEKKATEEDVQSIIDELLSGTPAPEPAPEPVPAPAPAPATEDRAATRRIDIDAVRRYYSGDGDAKRAWDEEDELTTPRPKFDFTDLKFGSNYADEAPTEGRKNRKDK